MVKQINEFYKVGYNYLGKHQWAVFFDIKTAQEAMLKMIQRGLDVTGLESQQLKPSKDNEL